MLFIKNTNRKLSEFHALLNSATFNIHAQRPTKKKTNKTSAMVARSSNDNKNEQFIINKMKTATNNKLDAKVENGKKGEKESTITSGSCSGSTESATAYFGADLGNDQGETEVKSGSDFK